MTTSSPRYRVRRSGVTLVELLVGMVIIGVVVGALMKLLVTQGRFADSAEAGRSSRSISRDAYNIMMTDLRMVQDTLAIQTATRDSVTVRVPYAYGIVCGTTAGVTTVSLLPSDSALVALATYGGVAYRDSATGVFQFFPKGGSGTIAPGVAAVCTDTIIVGGVRRPGVTPLTYNGRPGAIVTVIPNLSAALPGNPMFLWQEITYAFRPSTAYPGMRGLWRRVTGGPSDEIIAPFDTSARFRFFVLNNDSSQATPPSNLNTIRGLDLRLNARSPNVPSGSKTPKINPAMTAVYFKDRRDP